MAKVLFSKGDRVRVTRLHACWDDSDRWVEGQIGKIDEWHPQLKEWLVWIEMPLEHESRLWRLADDELERA